MLPHQKSTFITIRPCEPDDHSFIYATYLRNNWYDKTNTTTLKKSTWMSMQQKRLERVMETDVILVACLTEEPDIIVGYAFEDGQTPFSYVKLAWRNPKLDVAGMLVQALGKTQNEKQR